MVPFTYQLAWYQSVSGLSFRPAVDIDGSSARWAEIADIDGDDDLDVVACNDASGAKEGREWLAVPSTGRQAWDAPRKTIYLKKPRQPEEEEGTRILTGVLHFRMRDRYYNDENA